MGEDWQEREIKEGVAGGTKEVGQKKKLEEDTLMRDGRNKITLTTSGTLSKSQAGILSTAISPLCQLPVYQVEERRNLVELTGADLYKAFQADLSDRNGLYIANDGTRNSGKNVSFGTFDSSSYDRSGYNEVDLDNPYVVQDHIDKRETVANNSVLPLNGEAYHNRKQRQKSLIGLPSLHLGSKYGKPVREPKCFPVFRWCLSLIGLTMLVIVIIIMCQLINEWIAGSMVEISHHSMHSTTTTTTSILPNRSSDEREGINVKNSSSHVVSTTEALANVKS